jgi:predicted RNA methylase
MGMLGQLYDVLYAVRPRYCSFLSSNALFSLLGLGFALVHSDAVYLLDCDRDALTLAQENVEYLIEEELIGPESEGGCMSVEIIAAKVRYVRSKAGRGERRRGDRGGKSGRGRGRGHNGRGRSNIPNLPKEQSAVESIHSQPLDLNQDDGIPLPSKMVDTVITNPPFGTKNNEGIDVQFLRTAIRLARSAVYSFHKTSTRQYLVKLLTSWGLNVEVVAEMKFDIQNMYKFHKEKVKDVEVDLIRVFWDDGVGGGDECESDSLDEEQE